jgi:HPt (histidine-containing phosphotransfer) domain-containing protein
MSGGDVMWDELRRVIERYKARLADEATLLEQILTRLDAPPGRAELKAFLHRIAGTAGTYELFDIATAASTLEHELDAGAKARHLREAGHRLALLMRAASNAKADG